MRAVGSSVPRCRDPLSDKVLLQLENRSAYEPNKSYQADGDKCGTEPASFAVFCAMLPNPCFLVRVIHPNGNRGLTPRCVGFFKSAKDAARTMVSVRNCFAPRSVLCAFLRRSNAHCARDRD